MAPIPSMRFRRNFPPELPRTFIEELTRPGDVVLDPMAGSGTTIVEAFLAGRQGIGFDIDPLVLLMAQVKVAQFDKAERIISVLFGDDPYAAGNVACAETGENRDCCGRQLHFKRERYANSNLSGGDWAKFGVSGSEDWGAAIGPQPAHDAGRISS